jgi:hypothetical protein
VIKIVFGSLAGVAAGFLTRPCCAVPAAMSVVGLSSVGFAQLAATYRPVFMSVSAAMLTAALWTTFRREGCAFNKVLAASATLVGFLLSLRILEVL